MTLSQRRVLINRRGLLAVPAVGLALSALPRGLMAQGADCSTLRAAIAGYNVVNTLDPAKATVISEFYVIWGLFNALLRFNAKMELEGDLAESWEIIGDRVVRFRLRKGVKFHDGVDCTAEDVKFTFDRLRDPATSSPHRAKFERVTEIRVVDPLTVEFETDRPYAPLLAYLTNCRTGSQIVPKHILSSDDGRAFGIKPIGTGPFRFDSLQPTSKVTCKANPDYFEKGKAIPQIVEFPLIAEESIGVTALLGGAVDITSTAPFADVGSLEKNPAVKVLKGNGLNSRFVLLNTAVAPFDDVHFRRAVAQAFSRDVMVKAILFGEGRTANGIIPAAMPTMHQKDPRPMTTFNPAAAKAELAKSRYGAGTEAIVVTWGNGWWKRFGEIFVGQVNQTLGTKLRLEVMDVNAAFGRVVRKDYQASIWGLIGNIDPDEYLYENMHSSGTRNFSNYRNPEFDKLVVAASQEIDPERRAALYRQAEDMMVNDAPVACCFENYVHNLQTTKVKGFSQTPYSGFGAQLADVSAC